jgi:hypothetical protein
MHTPERFEKLALATEHPACIHPKGTIVVGHVSVATVRVLASLANRTYPGMAIERITVVGRHAVVTTGRDCDEHHGSSGLEVMMRRDHGRWEIKGTANWVE